MCAPSATDSIIRTPCVPVVNCSCFRVYAVRHHLLSTYLRMYYIQYMAGLEMYSRVVTSETCRMAEEVELVQHFFLSFMITYERDPPSWLGCQSTVIYIDEPLVIIVSSILWLREARPFKTPAINLCTKACDFR